MNGKNTNQNCVRASLVLLSLMLVMSIGMSAMAEAFDVSAYTYDELLVIRDSVATTIAEMERQYAIENGNRKITFEEPQLLLLKGRTSQLEPDVRRVVEQAPQKTTLVYASSNTEVAKVSSTGLVTAVSSGEAIITCSAKDDELIFCELPVQVVEPVSALSIDQASVELLLKNHQPAAAQTDLTVTIEPENAFYQTVMWASSDEAVAVVDENGHVQALAPGSATITATSQEEPAKGKKAKSVTCKVTVGQAVEEIQLNETELVLNKGKGNKLTATVLPENATKKAVNWTSSNPDVVSVTKEGRITSKTCGTSTILCEAADGSGTIASCTVDVIQMVTNLTPEVKTLTLNRDTSGKVSIKIMPEDATEKTLAWSSSEPQIVSVSEDGELYAANGGSSTITCTATDGSEKTASFTVYVPSIAIEATDYTVTSKEGLKFAFDYYGHYDALSIVPSAKNIVEVSFEQGEGNKIDVNLKPLKFGKVALMVKDNNESKSSVKVNVSVEHSAVYDSVSYPKASYDAILRDPDQHYGDKISIYGRVLQKMQSGSTVVLRVGTRGYNDVFYVRYDTDDLKVSIIEDDRITVYGVCLGDYTYEAVWGNSITIPEMRAEKITLSK